jgi:acyl-CoA synthetase (AMP-forming)/AMP-acid ligase II
MPGQGQTASRGCCPPTANAMTNLASILTDSVTRYPDRVVSRLNDTTLTYVGLRDLSGRVAGQLRRHFFNRLNTTIKEPAGTRWG